MSITELISLSVGIIGTGIAIYQQAIIKGKSKENKRLQYLLTGISHLHVGKNLAWQNQLQAKMMFFLEMKNQKKIDSLDVEVTYHVLLNTIMKIRDEFAELQALTEALEGVIDSDNSASIDKMKRNIEFNQLNKTMQDLSKRQHGQAQQEKNNSASGESANAESDA